MDLDLNKNQQAAMADYLEKQKAKAAAKVENQQSVEGQTEVPKPTEEQSKPEAEVAPKDSKEEAVKAEETLAIEKPEDTELLSWDADETQKPEPVKFDFGKIGSALELGEIKDESELVQKVSELRTKVKQLEESPLKGIPDDLKEVLEVTRKTGDWRQYLEETLVDYSKVDPMKLYEERFFKQAVQLPKFRNADGTVNQEAILDALESIPEVTRMIEGGNIQQNMIANQQVKKNLILQKAQEKVQEADRALVTASKSLNDLLPFDSYGIKFEPKHFSQIYEGISSSQLTKKHLGVSYEDLVRSGADMKAVSRTVAAAEYAEQMVKFKAKNSQTLAKRELLQKVQNVQLTTSGTTVTPESEKKRELSPAEKIKAHLESQRKGLGK